jgi:hypothetical protein
LPPKSITSPSVIGVNGGKENPYFLQASANSGMFVKLYASSLSAGFIKALSK